jgi:hypothetical protein
MATWTVGIMIAGCAPSLDRAGLSVGLPDAKVPDGAAVPLVLAAFRDGFKMCSRSGPSWVTSYWEVPREEVQRVDAALLAHLRAAHEGMTMAYMPEKYVRQYAGFRRWGRPFIYVNAFPTDYLPRPRLDPSQLILTRCDGGDSFWGIEYDVRRGTFDAFETNSEPTFLEE